MLNRIVIRPPLPLTTYASRCKTCQCACGAILQPQIPTAVERIAPTKRGRDVSTKARAPTTRSVERSQKSKVLSPEVARKQKELDEVIATYSSQLITDFCSKGIVKLDVMLGLEFLEAFQELANKVHTGNEVNLEPFRKLLSAIGVEHLGSGTQREFDVFIIALGLLNAHREAESVRRVGKKLMFSLSAVGNELATTQILHHAVLQSHNRRGVLRSAELIRPRAHLQKLAREGKSCGALTLEGKIALQLDDEEYALSCFQRALQLAERVAELQEAITKKFDEKAKAKELRDMDELLTPWVELYLLHSHRTGRHQKRLEAAQRQSPEAAKERSDMRKERAEAERVMKIGLRCDDPFMAYQAASSFSSPWSGEWLYYMNKAAASGMMPAMHKLAIFYSNSSWKYLKDEPPDHVKPTAFDSFPRPGLIASTAASVFSFVEFLFSHKKVHGKQDRDQKIDAKQGSNEIFYTASWPSTAKDRVRLALEWLEVAAANTYVPSALEAAKLYLMPELPLGLDAPKEALALKDSRYGFKNREQYESEKKGIDSNTNRKKSEDVEGAGRKFPPQASRPNPWYDQDKARHHIREIFFAAQAIEFRDDLLRKKLALPRRHAITNIAEALDRDDGRIDQFELEPAKAKYLKFSTIREQYEEELPELVAGAKEICDKMDWQIRDVDDGLLYQPSPTYEKD